MDLTTASSPCGVPTESSSEFSKQQKGYGDTSGHYTQSHLHREVYKTIPEMRTPPQDTMHGPIYLRTKLTGHLTNRDIFSCPITGKFNFELCDDPFPSVCLMLMRSHCLFDNNCVHFFVISTSSMLVSHMCHALIISTCLHICMYNHTHSYTYTHNCMHIHSHIP